MGGGGSLENSSKFPSILMRRQGLQAFSGQAPGGRRPEGRRGSKGRQSPQVLLRGCGGQIYVPRVLDCSRRRRPSVGAEKAAPAAPRRPATPNNAVPRGQKEAKRPDAGRAVREHPQLPPARFRLSRTD